MVVRDESGDILDTNQSSTTQLYQHHMYAIERIRKATVSFIFFCFMNHCMYIHFVMMHFFSSLTF